MLCNCLAFDEAALKALLAYLLTYLLTCLGYIAEQQLISMAYLCCVFLLFIYFIAVHVFIRRVSIILQCLINFGTVYIAATIS